MSRRGLLHAIPTQLLHVDKIRNMSAGIKCLDRMVVRYGIAVVAVTAAVFLRLPFAEILGSKAAFVTFYPAVMVAAVLGGFRAGILASILAIVAADYWVLTPAEFFHMSAADIISVIIFEVMGVFMSSVAGLYHRARTRAAEYETKLARCESEAQFRTMADAIPQLAWMADPDGYIFWYNQRWYEYTGTTPEQMRGWGWQSVHDPNVLPKAMERWQTSIATSQPFDMEFPLLGADGKFRIFLTRVMPMKDSEGRVTRWFGTNTDVSEARELEAHKRDFYQRTILAATEGKLMISERHIIEEMAGPALSTWDIHNKIDARQATGAISHFAGEAGMEEQRVYEFLGCVTEAATNVLKHAGEGSLSLHKLEDSLLCVVSDSGPGIGAMALPDVALTRHYSTVGTLGMGYKLIIHFADKVCLATGSEGTMVAIEMKLHKDTTHLKSSAVPQIASWT